MAEITTETVHKIARLANLALTEEEDERAAVLSSSRLPWEDEDDRVADLFADAGRMEDNRLRRKPR